MHEAQASLPFPCAGMLGILGMFVSCYGAEADHRDVCKIFRFNLRKPSTSAIYHAVYNLFEAVKKCNTYEPVFLMEPVSPCDREYLDCGVRFTATHTSKRMQAEIGIINFGDCVIWNDVDTRQCGKALFFARVHRVTEHNQRIELGCLARLFNKQADGWWHDLGTNVWVNATAIDFTVPFVQSGLRIMPLIPDF